MQPNYGGKANSLIKLKTNGFCVPNFFIIDTQDYESFLTFNNLKEQIRKWIQEQKESEIEQWILKSKLPKELQQKIDDIWKKLNTDKVAVRSSAQNEDGKKESFAGQYTTKLNVSYPDLEQAIKECWTSLYKENIRLYTNEQILDGMNVIIQEMIEPDFAGVAFSKDINSSTGNYSIIEVVKGTGEKLVSGTITPTKYLMRRETLLSDLKIGDIELDAKILKQIEENILAIETLYKEPVDIEYAIKKETIYILQARPITASGIIPVPFSLAITRPKSIIEEEIYFKGEFEGIKNVTRNLYYFKPLFIYNKKEKNVGVYYNELDLEEDPNRMYYYMDLDWDKTKQKYEKVKKDIQYLNNIIEKKQQIKLKDYIDKIISIYPFISLGQLAGHFDNLSDNLKELLYDFRTHYDDIIHNAMDYLLETVKNNLPPKLQEMDEFITLEEYQTQKYPSLTTLKKRQNGYIYYEKLYVTEDYENWLKQNNKYIKTKEENRGKGQIAYPGVRTGRVCKIFNEHDFDKFQKGDILVTPMTVPKFMKVIKQASAIITDEGGLTCHAAIISRELKIPCIVGCHNITEQLENGTKIKVDANIGEIKILSKIKDE